jgi:hypothetical protein
MTRFRQVPIFRELRGRNSLTLLLNAQKSCAASGRSRVMIADGRIRDLVGQVVGGTTRWTFQFSAKQHRVVRRWISRAISLKGLFSSASNIATWIPRDVLSGAGTRAHGGRFAPIPSQFTCRQMESGASKKVRTPKSFEENLRHHSLVLVT